MRFNKKHKTLFLDIKSPKTNIDEKVNVVLSPSFYWVKKVSLAVKHVREVKKVLPSIFEENLPDGNYSYFVYKKDDDFIAFAYDDKFILDTLSSLGISPSNIADVYFAQSEFEDMKDVLKINEDEVLYIKDSLVTLVPLQWVSEYKEMDLSKIKHSKHIVHLHQYSHILGNSALYKIGSILLAFSLLSGAQYFITAKKRADIVDKKERLFIKYGLKPTMIQNRSMLKKYSSIYERQTIMREHISRILNLKKKLYLLEFKNNALSADIKELSKSDERHVANELRSKNIKFKISNSNKITHLEIYL